MERVARECDHGERHESEGRTPQQAIFPNYKLLALRLTHVFLKLHDLQLTLIPFSPGT
jgi:hypothetical protein